MQDPAMFQSMKLPHFPEHEQLKCPRCDSTNTKFCYYNNYNLSQPRHFCKNCRRYWTKGGALRNIPVGGGTRKSNPKKPNSKKPSSSSSSSTSSSSPASAPPAALEPAVPKPEPAGLYSAGQAGSDHDRPRMLDVPGSFNSLMSANGQFGSLMEGVNLGAAAAAHHTQELVFGEYMENGSDQVSGTAGGSIEETRDLSCWNSTNGWPDLAIYTPSSRFQ